MTSFKKRLLLILIGVVFINFLLIGISFNILIGQYIKNQAEKELLSSMYSMQGVAPTIPVTIAPAMLIQGTDGVSVVKGDALKESQKSDAIIKRNDTDTLQEDNSFRRSENISELHKVNAGKTEEGSLPSSIAISADVLDIMKAVPAATSVIATNYIIFDEHNKVVYPVEYYISKDMKTTVEYLSNYFKENRNEFKDSSLIKTTAGNNTYYASLLLKDAVNANYSVLLYTDITPVQSFANMINFVLLAVLVISGVVTVLVGIRMYGGLNKAINSLCGYAEQIGHGKFDTVYRKQYSYDEFNHLANSMSDMSKKLESYDKQKQMFFQNVSHELRTPLMSIQGYAEGISQEVFDNNIEAADVIVMQSEKMLSLVNELLYISRMDSGLQQLNKSMFDVKDVLLACMDSLKIIANREGKNINTYFPDYSAYIEADQEQLLKAISNILINCIRHAKTEVGISYAAVGKELKIEITDDGNGIALKDLPHVFERFYMGVNGKSGLGLSITKEIIEKHKGRVIAENSDTGAKFTIFLLLSGNT